MSIAPFEHEDHKVNVLDTPGTPTSSATLPLPSAPPTSPCSSCPVEGVEVQTEMAADRRAGQAPTRRVREQARLGTGVVRATLDDLKAKFGAGVAPLELPIGEETVPRCRRPAHRHRGDVRRHDRRAPRAPCPTRWQAKSTPSTTPHRGHRRRRRRPDGAVPRRRVHRGEGASSRLWPREHRRGNGVPGVVRQRTKLIGVDRLALPSSSTRGRHRRLTVTGTHRWRSCSRRSSIPTWGA
jgi:hypothetical protein